MIPLLRQGRRQALLWLLFCSIFLTTPSLYAAPLAQAPAPQSDRATTAEDTPVLINVLANDTETNGLPLTLLAAGTPRKGKVEIVGNQIRYTPAANFFGNDSFFYIVHNGDFAKARQTTVDVTITPVNDAPTAVLLRATIFGTNAPPPLSENTAVNTIIGQIMARDPDLACNIIFIDADCRTRLNDRDYLFTLVGTNNDNGFFAIERTSDGLVNLVLTQSLVGRGKPSYTIGVQVRDPNGVAFTQDISFPGAAANNPPTAITLSNNRVDENAPSGTSVGSFSSVDPDSPGVLDHTYTLVDGSGSDDNFVFGIFGAELRTAAVLDFEFKAVHSIRVRSTDKSGNSFEQILLVTLNNLPEPTVTPTPTTTPTPGPTPVATPSPTPVNTLSYCSGNPITLFEFTSSVASKRVLVRIDTVVISALTATGCTVDGKMTITTNGNTRTNLTFSGEVNARNQFRTSEIPDFEFNVAGIQLIARAVEIAYINERPTLHITRPEFKMPIEFGGLSAQISVPTSIDTGGVKFGTGRINLPSIRTISGFALELSGSLRSVPNGFEIQADGDLTIPNIKKGKAANGRECTIGAGVTIFADAQGQTVMAIAAGTPNTTDTTPAPQGPLTSAEAGSPAIVEALRLGAVRARASCDPGLPIGSTGLFLTSVSGEVTLIPGREQVDIEVEIQAGKSLPIVGPIVSVDGSMSLRPNPFQLDLGGTLTVLIFKMAQADATIVAQGFKARIQTSQFFGFIPYTTDVSITAFTRSGGQFTFAGSGRVAIEMKRGSFGEKCTPGFLFIPAFCIPLPPFDLPTLAAARVEAGEFTNQTFGFKGIVDLFGIGSAGFFVNDRGSLTFRNVDSFKLITPPFLAAARAAWENAQKTGQTVNAAAWQGLTFLQDAAGNNSGVIVDVPLTKPMIDLGQMQAAGATDVISQVNLIRNGDVLFNLIATQPLGLSLITPGGQEVTGANYASVSSYKINYSQSITWGTEKEQAQGSNGNFVAPVTGKDAVTSTRLLFTPVSFDTTLIHLDLIVDGVTVYYDLDPQDTAWLTPLVLQPGNHIVELRKNGTANVVLQYSLAMITDTNYSLVTFGGANKGAANLVDDNRAPATMGKAKVRFVNMATPDITMLVNGTPLFSNINYFANAGYGSLNAGPNTIEFRNSTTNELVAAALNVNLADGGVYTFFATDDVGDAVPGFVVRILQRTDARYSPVYYTTFTVDQALMNESWKVKVSGDTTNVPFQLNVEGLDSPPILGTVTVDASNPAATQVGWQLTSDINPTTVQIYVNPGEISGSFTITDTNGTPNTAVIPRYEGQLVGEFKITNVAELGGQLVTKVVDLSKLPSGTYYLWVRADDGINPPVTSYAATPALVAASADQSGYGRNVVWLAKADYDIATEFANATPIVINRAATFPTQWNATITTTLNTADKTLDVEWRVNSHPDVDRYRLLFGNTPLNPTVAITVGGALAVLDANGNPTGAEVGFVRIADIRPDVTYYISVEAIDSESGRSVRSQEVPFTVASTPFTLAAQQTTVAVAAGGSASIPITLNAGGTLFFPNVWLSTDLGNTPPGITARFAGDAEGFPGLNAGAPTRNLEINVDSEVPDGLYPIVIAGYNGDVKTALTLQVMVGEGSTNALYLPLVTR